MTALLVLLVVAGVVVLAVDWLVAPRGMRGER